MAKERIIKVTDKNSGAESLVTATSVKKAIEYATSKRFEGSVASAEDVTRLVNGGTKVQVFEKIPLISDQAQNIADGAQKAADNLIAATTPQAGFQPAVATVEVTNDDPEAK